MERIKGKNDDLSQKIRPGTTWVSGFTVPGNNDDLRAIDSDGAELRVIPQSRYYASCTIKRGQAVSIAQLADLTDEQRSNKYAYVKITDPDIDETCIGVAMNYAEEGQIVHIQSTGKFNYYTTSSILYSGDRKDREIFLNADGWLFDEVRGQKLYISKTYNNSTNAESNDTEDKLRESSTYEGVPVDENGDAFDTDHTDKKDNADTTNLFTYDFINNVYNTKNTIQIGTLTDAPTTQNSSYTKGDNGWLDPNGDEVEAVLIKVVNGELLTAEPYTNKTTGTTFETGVRPPKPNETLWLQKVIDSEDNELYVAVDDFVVTIELSVTGDTRGPIDNTQFIVTLGESIYFDCKKQDVELTSPSYNEGIYDEIKVLAIAQGNPRNAVFRFFSKAEVDIDSNPVEHGFIALRKLDGDTFIIPVLCRDSTLNDYSALIDPNDEGYIKLSKQFTGELAVNRTYIENGVEVVRKPRITVSQNPVTVVNRGTLKDAITEGFKQIFVDEETFEVGCDVETYNIGDNGFNVTLDKVGGYYDVYVSQDLLKFISITQVDHGQAAPAGSAILADIRDSNRLNVVGIVVSNQSGVHKKGETVKVMRAGRLVTLGNLQPGVQYYLGLNGRITAQSQFWYDHCLPVAIAESTNYLLVDLSQLPLHSYSGNFPLGYLKPSIHGRAEKGFVLADGYTLYSKEEHRELYELLLNWFNEEELKPSNVSKELHDKYVKKTIEDIIDDIYTLITKNRMDIQDIQRVDESQDLRLDNLEQRATDIESVYDSQNLRLENLEQRATNIESVNESQQNSITELDTRLTGVRQELTEDIDSLDTKLTSQIEESKNSLEIEITETKGSLKTEIEDTKNSLETEIEKTKTELTESIDSKEQALDKKIENTKTELSTSIDSVESSLTEGIENVSKSVEVTNQNLESTTNDLSEKIESLKTRTTALETTIVDKTDTGTTDSLQTTVQSLNKEITGLESDVNTLKSSISGLSSIDFAKNLDESTATIKVQSISVSSGNIYMLTANQSLVGATFTWDCDTRSETTSSPMFITSNSEELVKKVTITGVDNTTIVKEL